MRAQVDLPSHFSITGAVRIKDNFWPSAKLVFDNGEDTSLAPKFPKGIGPNAAEFSQINSAYAEIAQEIGEEVARQERSLNAGAISSNDIVQALDENERVRRKRVAEKALAKQSAKRGFKAVGTVVL